MTPSRQRLALFPRDGFYAKDGRGWGSATRGYGVDWPWQTTLRGALTTASGKVTEPSNNFTPSDWETHQKSILIHRTVAVRMPVDQPICQNHRVWPVPADALWLEGRETVLRLDPIPRNGADEQHVETLGRKGDIAIDAAREQLWLPRNVDDNAKPLIAPRWWDEATFVNWLCANNIATKLSPAPIKQWPGPDKRLQSHVGIGPDTLTADDGILFQHDVIETLGWHGQEATREAFEWAMAIEAVLPNRFDTARLGADSRIAFARNDLASEVFALPAAVRSAFDTNKSDKMRLVITTPAIFQNGWLPDGFQPTGEAPYEFHGSLAGIPDLVLRAAFVPRPQHLSGWHMAGTTTEGGTSRPGAARQTRRLVPPGAVYFFEKSSGFFTAEDADTIWSSSFGCDGEVGFGRAAPGIWKGL